MDSVFPSDQVSVVCAIVSQVARLSRCDKLTQTVAAVAPEYATMTATLRFISDRVFRWKGMGAMKNESGRKIQFPTRSLCTFISLFSFVTLSQAPQTLSIPADSPQWSLEGKAKVTEYLGRKCLSLDGGAASVVDLDMRDGAIDVDVATATKFLCGSFGLTRRAGRNGLEWRGARRTAPCDAGWCYRARQLLDAAAPIFYRPLSPSSIPPGPSLPSRASPS